jgi:signal recognition particle GTPase
VKGPEINKTSEVNSVLKERLRQDEQRRIAHESQLRSAQAEAARLGKQLEEKQASLMASEQSGHSAENAVAELRRQLEEARTRETRTEAKLEKLKATDEAVTAVQQQEIETLNSKMAAKSASLDREREMLSAGREIRDLIAARNLHIIDVYDTNGQGKTSRAFGRVFYTEGKSLVFYAYDLNAHQANAAKLAFYVWGKRDGAPQYVKVLGRMSKDDQAQKRWALTITDPKTLAEIDSVFVTLEPAENAGIKPSGKPLLSAFLGSPANHP